MKKKCIIYKSKNKTSNTVVLADTQELKKKLYLQVGTENRASNNNNLNVVIYPDETKRIYTKLYKVFLTKKIKQKHYYLMRYEYYHNTLAFTDLHKSELNKSWKIV